jgi:hypothetical protein
MRAFSGEDWGFLTGDAGMLHVSSPCAVLIAEVKVNVDTGCDRVDRFAV